MKTFRWFGADMTAQEALDPAVILARLAAFHRQRPRPWHAGGRHSNRNLRRKAAVAAHRRLQAAADRWDSQAMAHAPR